MNVGDKVYLVKRWQTEGIKEAVISWIGGHGIHVEGDRYTQHMHREWFATEAGALNKVEELRQRAIASTEKKLDKLKRMKIKVKRLEVAT